MITASLLLLAFPLASPEYEIPLRFEFEQLVLHVTPDLFSGLKCVPQTGHAFSGILPFFIQKHFLEQKTYSYFLSSPGLL